MPTKLTYQYNIHIEQQQQQQNYFYSFYTFFIIYSSNDDYVKRILDSEKRQALPFDVISMNILILKYDFCTS